MVNTPSRRSVIGTRSRIANNNPSNKINHTNSNLNYNKPESLSKNATISAKIDVPSTPTPASVVDTPTEKESILLKQRDHIIQDNVDLRLEIEELKLKLAKYELVDQEKSKAEMKDAGTQTIEITKEDQQVQVTVRTKTFATQVNLKPTPAPPSVSKQPVDTSVAVADVHPSNLTKWLSDNDIMKCLNQLQLRDDMYIVDPCVTSLIKNKKKLFQTT